MTSALDQSEVEQFREFVTLLDRVADVTTRLLNGFKQKRIARDSHQAFVLVTLHHMNQKCLAIVAMANARTLAGIGVVARSVYETYADVINLCQFSDYHVYMEWLSLDQQRTFLEGVDGHADEAFKLKYSENALRLNGKTLAEGLAAVRSDLAELGALLHARYKRAGGEVIGHGTHRFKLAEQMSNYNIVYRYLSGPAHGKLSAMLEGVFVEDDFRWPPVDTENRPLVAFDSSCAMLIDASDRVAKKYGRSDEVFQKLAKRKQEIFDKYQRSRP